MVKNCVKDFQKSSEEKVQNIHLNDKFPLKIASISLPSKSKISREWDDQIPHFVHTFFKPHKYGRTFLKYQIFICFLYGLIIFKCGVSIALSAICKPCTSWKSLLAFQIPTFKISLGKWLWWHTSANFKRPAAFDTVVSPEAKSEHLWSSRAQNKNVP